MNQFSVDTPAGLKTRQFHFQTGLMLRRPMLNQFSVDTPAGPEAQKPAPDLERKIRRTSGLAREGGCTSTRPRGPLKGPRGPFKGPRGPFKGTRVPFKGPRGPLKGPRGPLKGPRGVRKAFGGFSDWGNGCRKRCSVKFSDTLQARLHFGRKFEIF